MSVSIIIPTLNEAGCLAETLNSLREQQPHEIIVVDGGSQDRTCEIAGQIRNPKSQIRNSLNLVLLQSIPGRARQMNLGAANATGDVLLFLHADCQLEAGSLAAAENCLSCRNIIAGCFTMQAQAAGLLYRWMDAFASARVRISGMIYGDQGLFLRRHDFLRLGRFPELALMEDVFFSQVLRREGRVIVSPKHIFVSARRWQRSGLIRQTLRNWALVGLAAGGVHPDRLAAFYPAIR